MNVYILALDHLTQNRDARERVPASYHEKFEKLVRALIAERGITFIGDETFQERFPIAKEVADSLHIDWERIEMTTKARKELDIEDEQLHERHQPMDMESWSSNAVFVPARRVPSDSIREEYMVWRAVKKAEEARAENLLILCGFQHADRLQVIFQRENHQVTMGSLCDYPWYRNVDCPKKK
jgi:hypothetical protein